MVLTCECTVINSSSRVSTSNGKTYYSIVVNSDDGQTFNFNCPDDIATNIKEFKFKKCRLQLDYSRNEYNGRVNYRFNLLNIKVI